MKFKSFSRLLVSLALVFSFAAGCKKNKDSTKLASSNAMNSVAQPASPDPFLPPERSYEIGDSFFLELYAELKKNQFKMGREQVDALIKSLAKSRPLIAEVVTSTAAYSTTPRNVYVIDTPGGPEYIGVSQRNRDNDPNMDSDPGLVSVEGLVYHPERRNFQPVALEYNPYENREHHLSSSGIVCSECHANPYREVQGLIWPITSRSGAFGSPVKTVYAHSDESGNNPFTDHIGNFKADSVKPGAVNRASFSLPDESLIARRERVKAALAKWADAELAKSPQSSLAMMKDYYLDLDTACGVCHGHFPNETSRNPLSSGWFQYLEKGFANMPETHLKENNTSVIETFVVAGTNPQAGRTMPVFEASFIALSPAEKELVAKAVINVKKFAETSLYKEEAGMRDAAGREEVLAAALKLSKEVATDCYANTWRASFSTLETQCKACCDKRSLEKPTSYYSVDMKTLFKTTFQSYCYSQCGTLSR